MRITRRSFFKVIVGGAFVVTGVAAFLLGTHPGRVLLDYVQSPAVKSKKVTLKINSKDVTLQVKANTTLLSLLRNDLKLTGTKLGCSNSECGACTVLLDGTPIYSCHRLAVEADGHQVTTIEGVSSESELSPLQKAFIEEGAFQCGFCTPGFIVTATALLESTPNPTDLEVKQALSGNICRCGSYPHIVNAVLAAANRE